MSHIKEEIKLKLLTKTGKVNSAILRRGWFKQSELFHSINNQITFTNNISEQIYCILNDIKSEPKCPTCNLLLKFKTFTTGYPKTCKKSICIRENNPWKSCSLTKIKNSKIEKNKLKAIYHEDNYKLLPKLEVFNYIEKRITNSKNGKYGRFVNSLSNTNMLCSIIYYTRLVIPLSQGFMWSQRFYLLHNNLNEIPKCISCGSKTKFINFIKGYQPTCSLKCCNSGYSQQQRVISHIEEIIPEIKRQNMTIISKPYNGLNSGRFTIQCNQCKRIFTSMLNNGRWQNIYCSSCHSSSIQKEIKQYLISLGENVIENDTTLLNGKEIDLYLPKRKMAVEVDGIYWHSELKGKKRNYHLSKTDSCGNLGISLLHIFENEWLESQEIVKSIIANKLRINSSKIYARKTKIKELDNKTKKDFLNKNHLQGNGRSQYKYGLYYEDELVSVMTFGKRKITNKKPEYEIIRFASKLGTNVIGGASKLLKYFEKTHNPERIITYSDRRYSTSNMFYQKLGFQYSHPSKPNYWYFKGNMNLLSRVNFQKHKLKDKLEKYDESLSEWENMKNNGYNRIWDCGNFVFTKDL